MTISVVFADDHSLVRLGLRCVLEREPDIAVHGEARDGREALQVFDQARPDVLLLDFIMPVMNGLQVTTEAKRLAPKTKIIILSMCQDEFFFQEAVKKGVDGYLVKSDAVAEIGEAIRSVMLGRCYASKILRKCSWGRPRSKTEKANPGLTLREREILHMIWRGMANKEIASFLSIGIRTVETHRARIMRKLNIRSHAGLIHYAAQEGSIS